MDVGQCREDGHGASVQSLAELLAGVEASSGVQIFHVTELNWGQSEALDAAGIKRRLVSYYFLKKEPRQNSGEIWIGARAKGF